VVDLQPNWFLTNWLGSAAEATKATGKSHFLSLLIIAPRLVGLACDKGVFQFGWSQVS
jgi:hypothetical protein